MQLVFFEDIALDIPDLIVLVVFSKDSLLVEWGKFLGLLKRCCVDIPLVFLRILVNELFLYDLIKVSNILAKLELVLVLFTLIKLEKSVMKPEHISLQKIGNLRWQTTRLNNRIQLLQLPIDFELNFLHPGLQNIAQTLLDIPTIYLLH